MGIRNRASGFAVLLNHSSGEPLELEPRSHDTLNARRNHCAKTSG
jgi:hypothetical protein